jgi:hypothetical protein
MTTRFKASLQIAVTCLLVRGAAAAATGYYRHFNRTELDKIAIAVSAGQGYSNAFGQRDEPSTGPTAHYPPVYPYLLSLVYGLGGTGSAGEIGKYAMNALIVSLLLGTLPFLGDAFSLSPRVALYAGLFGAAVPLYLLTELRGGELPFVALLLAIATLAFRSTLQRATFSSWEAAGHGLLWGLIFCTAPSPAPTLVLWLGLLLFARRAPPRTALRFIAITVVIAATALLPWTIRNYRVLGQPIVARSNLGLELRVSNNDLATATGYENQSGTVFDSYHPNRSAEERLRYREIGEVAYEREKMAEALSWILGHKARFLRLSLLRAWYFWTAPPRRPFEFPVLYAISALAIFGLVRVAKKDGLAAAQVVCLWLGSSFIYYFVQFENRYRYPVYWSLLLLAAAGAMSLREQRLRQPVADRSPSGEPAALPVPTAGLEARRDHSGIS